MTDKFGVRNLHFKEGVMSEQEEDGASATVSLGTTEDDLDREYQDYYEDYYNGGKPNLTPKVTRGFIR